MFLRFLEGYEKYCSIMWLFDGFGIMEGKYYKLC